MDTNKIIKEQIELKKPNEEAIENIKRIAEEFCKNLESRLKKEKIKAEVFIGGSLAKNTLVLRDDNLYDVDIFVRFDKEYNEEEIQKLLKKVLAKNLNKNMKKIHGSRDYYQFKNKGAVIEVIPVLKINKPEEAKNITDLSYFHVNYILNKIKKNKNLEDEIIIAKAFVHGQNCYGAESYIKGFSGYALELLIMHYGSFLNFIKEIAKAKDNEKIIIDDSKFYDKKINVLRELNGAKIQSPMILIDPTFKERNALSGMSSETFLKFKKACEEFLKNPSKDFFKKKNILDEMKNYKNLRIISVKTNKQKGDIAGTKSKKFFNFFIFKLKKEFEVEKSEFEYKEKENIANYYFVLGKKQGETIRGPPITLVQNLTNFRKIHPDSFVKNQFAYANISHNLSFKDFINNFLGKDKKIIKEMSIEEIRLIK